MKRAEEKLQKKHYEIFSVAHRIVRIDRSIKYIEKWATAVPVDPRDDMAEYTKMRAIIPKAWMTEEEREILNRRFPTRNRDEFRLEVASKLLVNVRQLKENETAHSIFLCSQMAALISGIQRQWFTEIFEELNALQEERVLNLEYFAGAQDLIRQYTLTNNVHRIHVFANGDVVANNEAEKIVTKLRDMAAQGMLNTQAIAAGTRHSELANIHLPAPLTFQADKVSSSRSPTTVANWT